MYLHTGTGCTDGDMRLVGGAIAQEGTIEICYEGSWGHICGYGWDVIDAFVACRQLGYTNSGMYVFYTCNNITA